MCTVELEGGYAKQWESANFSVLHSQTGEKNERTNKNDEKVNIGTAFQVDRPLTPEFEHIDIGLTNRGTLFARQVGRLFYTDIQLTC